MNISSYQLLGLLVFIGIVSSMMLLFSNPVVEPVKPKMAINEIVLPEGLKKSFHFEPSGILWVEEFNGYIVVSDDTGRGNVRNLPLLFLMDSNGHIKQKIIKLKGIRQIEDIESICRDDDGFIYLLSSQSVSLKGKKNSVRELFLKTRISGRNLEVVSFVYLTTMLENISKTNKDFLDNLEVPDLTQLDIEGMAWYDKKFYFGLNAPLKDDEYALIWCIENASLLFETPDKDNVIANLFSLWGKVRLRSYKQKGHSDGIADMLFTDTGDLVLLSGKKKGGFIWYVPSPQKGVLKPEKIKKIKGYNPEGVCLTPGQKDMITVVFDQGDNKSAWLTLKIR